MFPKTLGCAGPPMDWTGLASEAIGLLSAAWTGQLEAAAALIGRELRLHAWAGQ